MKKIANNTVAFIGDKILITPNGSPDNNLINVIRTELQLVIDDLCKDGKTYFLTGLEPGFDILAAEVVLECTKKYPSIELHAIIPYPGHELCYSDADKVRYKRLYEASTKRIYLNEWFNEEAFTQQMEYMVAESSEMVLFYKELNPDVEKLLDNKAWNMYQELEEYFAIQSPIKDFLQNYPNVTSFRYGRDGVVFRGANERPLSVEFAEIEKIKRGQNFLCFFLRNDMCYFASLTSDEVRVLHPRPRGYC